MVVKRAVSPGDGAFIDIPFVGGVRRNGIVYERATAGVELTEETLQLIRTRLADTSTPYVHLTADERTQVLILHRYRGDHLLRTT